MMDKPRPGPDSVRLERTIAAHRETVFDAWLNADVLKRWWPAGSDWETPIAQVDARVGGKLRLVMRSPDGEEFGGTGEFMRDRAAGAARLQLDLGRTWCTSGHEPR